MEDEYNNNVKMFEEFKKTAEKIEKATKQLTLLTESMILNENIMSCRIETVERNMRLFVAHQKEVNTNHVERLCKIEQGLII